MIVTQLSTAPDRMPGARAGTITRISVLNFEAPRLIAASSTLGLS
jgi:hypothetical protein